MSRIKKTGESIKRKLECREVVVDQGYDFYRGVTEQIQAVMPASQHASKPVRQQLKKKVTFYLPLDIEKKLNEIYTRRLMKNEKEDKSSIICRAIDLMWKQEKNYDYE